VALAHALHDPRGHALARRVVGGRHGPFIAAGLVVLLMGYPSLDLSGVPRMAIHASMVLLVAACVVREDHAAMPLLRLAPVARIGALSYGIYLLHPFCRHLAAKVLGSDESIALFVSTLALTLGAAEVSYRLLESRCLALKARFAPPSAPSIRPIEPERVPAALELVDRLRQGARETHVPPPAAPRDLMPR
jgi:peptidoglycan/LPS O-acetylase OafA/YrhL